MCPNTTYRRGSYTKRAVLYHITLPPISLRPPALRGSRARARALCELVRETPPTPRRVSHISRLYYPLINLARRTARSGLTNGPRRSSGAGFRCWGSVTVGGSRFPRACLGPGGRGPAALHTRSSRFTQASRRRRSDGLECIQYPCTRAGGLHTRDSP